MSSPKTSQQGSRKYQNVNPITGAGIWPGPRVLVFALAGIAVLWPLSSQAQTVNDAPPNPPLKIRTPAAVSPMLDTSADDDNDDDAQDRQRQPRRKSARRRTSQNQYGDQPKNELQARPLRLRTRAEVDDEWSRRARFFGGLRSSLAFPPGGMGPATTVGMELGVAAYRGLGFGLHIYGVGNPSGVPMLELPAAAWGVGASADARWYLQTIEPLKLYPTLSVGFIAGPDKVTGENVVLPMINPGFGARVNLADMYVAFEIGLASLYMPFVGFSIGWEPTRKLE